MILSCDSVGLGHVELFYTKAIYCSQYDCHIFFLVCVKYNGRWYLRTTQLLGFSIKLELEKYSTVNCLHAQLYHSPLLDDINF